MNQVTINYYNILNKINQLANSNNPLTLIAVSKTFAPNLIIQLYELGQKDFAENYAQELAFKAQQLNNLKINWHFIGNIQSNKIKLISKYASWVHSLSCPKHAILLNTARMAHSKNPLNVLIEVNISHDKNKSGVFNLEEILSLAQVISAHQQLRLRGLMGIASYTNDNKIIAQQFGQLHHFFNQLKIHGYVVDTLSMGMSADYQLAIENGATMLRIGSLIFGSRAT
ncbi:MAG: YggS family pyridoxal phosphate-dependent enzyme [Burkholderiales bacterium]|nr:YggS family pyridoxal phosphate-dependent enzyme [Burkholderiales bacterium]